MASNAATFGLNCPLCLRLFTSPKTLPCMHSFCENCLIKHAGKIVQNGGTQSDLDCPCLTCHNRSSVANGFTLETWIKRMPTKRALAPAAAACTSIVDVALCAACQKTQKHVTSTMFCFECGQFQCDACAKDHDKYPNLESHKIVRSEELTNQEMQVVDYELLEKCREHTKILEHFCIDHLAVCCAECLTAKHSTCRNTQRIADIGQSGFDLNPEDLKTSLLQLRNQLECSTRFFNESEDTVKSHSRVMKQHFDILRKTLNDNLDAFEREMGRKADPLKEEALGRFQVNRARSENLKAAVESSVLTLDEVVKHGTTSQIFVATQKLAVQLNEYEHEAAKAPFDNLRSLEIELKIGDDTERVLNEGLKGDLNTKYTSHTLDSLLDYRPAKLELVVEKQLIQGQDGDEAQPLLTGLTYLPDGRLVAIDNKNKKCLLMDNTLKILGSYQLNCKVYGVTTDVDDQIMITSVKKLICLRVKSNNTIVHISTTDTTCNSDSISAMGPDTFMIGGHDDDKPAHIVSRTGTVTDLKLDDLPTQQFGLDKSKCAFSDASAQFTLTDREQDTVYVFNTDHGRRLTVRHPDIKVPRGVAIDQTGCSFVCCQNTTSSIVQISPIGHVMGNLPLNAMTAPRTICVSGDNKFMAVSNAATADRALRVYQLRWDRNN